jgi:5-formyltetrahydrofolate cyclo-ligase
MITVWPAFQRARNVAFYAAADGEIDPSALLRVATRYGKQCYLPVITDRRMSWRSSPLQFHAFIPGDPVRTNRFGILEPVFDHSRVLATSMLDIIFLPLVGFDRAGSRLGMGGGFYDRALASMPGQFRRPKLVGLAHALQEIPTIETRPWDVNLDVVITDREIIVTVAKVRTPAPPH